LRPELARKIELDKTVLGYIQISSSAMILS